VTDRGTSATTSNRAQAEHDAAGWHSID
jgi:hypothetical protein